MDSSGKNTWTISGSLINASGDGADSQTAWTVVQTGGGGSITITITPAVSDYLSLACDEFSCVGTPTVGTIVTNTGASTTASSGNVTFSSAGNYLLLGSFVSYYAATWAAGSGFTAGVNLPFGAGNYCGILSEYILNTTSASSPEASTCALTGSPYYFAASGVAFHEVPPPSGGGGSTMRVKSPRRLTPGRVHQARRFRAPQPANITSNGTGGGNWSATTTWAGGVVPVPGVNTVTIAAGDTVNVDSASETSGQLIVGNDPGTGNTAAITIGSSSQTTATNLVVNAGCTLRLRGDLTLTGQNVSSGGIFSTLTMSSGSSLILDPPSGSTYVVNLEYLSKIVCNGATNTGAWPDTAGGNHVTVKTDLTRGGNNAYTVCAYTTPNWWQNLITFGGWMTATFTDFSNLGNTSAYGLITCMQVYFYGHATDAVNVTNCTFNACSYVILAESGTWTGNFIFTDNLFSNTIQTSVFGQVGGSWFNIFTAPTSETKEILRCGFDRQVTLDGTQNLTIAGNVFAGDIGQDNTTAWTSAAQFNNNFIARAPNTPVEGINFGPFHDCYCLFTSANPGSTWVNTVSTGVTISGIIFDALSGDGSLAVNSFGGAISVLNSLILQTPGAATSTGIYATNGELTIEHCLQVGYGGYSSFPGFISLGSQAPASAGQVVSCRSNIIWSSTATSQVMAITESGSSTYTLDAVTVAGYNAFHNPTSGTNKYNAGGGSASVVGYSGLEVTNATAFAAEGGGAGNTQIKSGFDFTADPVFADSTLRNFVSWANVVGGQSATYAAAIAYLLAKPSLLPSMLTWVRYGYSPTNAAFLNTTYAGDTQTTDANGNLNNGAVGPMGCALRASYGPGSTLRAATRTRIDGPLRNAIYN